MSDTGNEVKVVSAGNPGKLAEVRPGGEMVYLWKKGRAVYLSKKVQILAEEYMKSRNYRLCADRFKVEFGRSITVPTVMRWLKHEVAQDWMGQRMEESGVYAGWTKEHWFKVMTDHLIGKVRLANGDLYGMSLIGKYKGWDMPASGSGFNQTINILQANGKE